MKLYYTLKKRYVPHFGVRANENHARATSVYYILRNTDYFSRQQVSRRVVVWKLINTYNVKFYVQLVIVGGSVRRRRSVSNSRRL